VNNEETVPGAVLIAAPLFDSNSHVCAAVSVSAPIVRYSPDRRKTIVQNLLATTRAITLDLAQIGFTLPEFRPTPQRSPSLQVAG